MSLAEFENLVERYLEGNISRAEEVRLLELIKESPEFKNRFKLKVRLSEAMKQCLAKNKSKQAYLSFAWLRIYVNRMSKVASYACLIALVFVQFRVTLPSEYSGMLYHLSEVVTEDSADFIDGFLTEETMAASDQDDFSDMGMPEFDNSEMAYPTDEEVAEA